LVSNCLIWGFWQYLRKGGYIIFQQANPPWPSWVPHCLWSPDLHEFWEFVPVPRGMAIVKPKFPIFRGRVKQALPVANKWIEGFAAGVEAAVKAGKR
jgi:hypothetical protein